MPRHDAGKGPDPRPMSKEGRANYERTLRNIYGVRVKIPPPGPEREALVAKITKRWEDGSFRHPHCWCNGDGMGGEESVGGWCEKCAVELVIELLEDEA